MEEDPEKQEWSCWTFKRKNVYNEIKMFMGRTAPMIAPAWGRLIQLWREGGSRNLKDCLQRKKSVKKKRLISSLTFYLSMHTCNIQCLISEIKPPAETSCSQPLAFVRFGSLLLFSVKVLKLFYMSLLRLTKNSNGRASRLVMLCFKCFGFVFTT